MMISIIESESQEEKTFCVDNQYININTFQCVTCPVKCEGCFDDQNCIKCSYGQNVNQECLDCIIPFCAKCSDQKICQTCQDGFKLSNDKSHCQNINDQSQIHISCNSGYKENNGDCLKQNICSSQDFRDNVYFNQNVIQVLEDEDSNLFIALSNKKIIAFDKESMKYVITFLEIPDSSQEIIIKGVYNKNILIILSNKSIYIYQVNPYKLILIRQFFQDEINGDTKIKYLYFNEKTKILNYFAITNYQKDVRIMQFELAKDKNGKKYYLRSLTDSNLFLLQQKNQFLVYQFTYNSDLKFISIMTSFNVFIVDLNNLKRLQIVQSHFEVNGNIQDLNQLFLLQSIYNKNEIFCYAIKQTETVVTQIKIVFDKLQDYTSINTNDNEFFELNSYPIIRDWQLLHPNNPLLEKYISQYIFIKGKLFIYTIASIYTDPIFKYSNKFFGIVEIEYFFNQKNQTEYNKLEIIDRIDYFINYPFIVNVKEIQNENNLLLILPYNNELMFFELQFEQQKMEKIYDTISLEQQEYDINIYSSIQSKVKSQFFCIVGKVIGKFSLPQKEKEKQIEIKMTNIYDFKVKKEIYFSQTKASQVIIPNDYNSQDSKSKYTFIIVNEYMLQRFSVTQMETLQNENQQMVGYRFYYYKKINFNKYQDIIIQQDSFQDDEQMLLVVITNNHIYKIKYHSLEIIESTQIEYFLAKNRNIIIYAKLVKIINNEIDNTDKYEYDIIASKQNIYNQNDVDTKTIATLFDLNIQQTIFFKINKINNNFSIFCMKLGPNILLKISINNQNIDFQDNHLSDIFDFEFISSYEIGFLIKYFDYQNNIPQFQFLKFSLEEQQDVYSYSIQQQTFSNQPQYECYFVDYSYFSMCGFRSTNGYSFTLFNWQTMNFVQTDQGDLYSEIINNYFREVFNDQEKSFEVLKFDFEKIDQSVYQINMILKIYYDLGGILSNTGLLGIIQFNLNTIDQRFKSGIVQKYFSVQITFMKQDVPNSDISIISSKDSNQIRLLSPRKFFLFGGYFDLGAIYMQKSLSVYQQANSLLLQNEGQIYSAKRYGAFEYNNNYKNNSKFIFQMRQKGLLMTQNTQYQYQLLEMDTLKIVHTFEFTVDPLNVSWSEKFQTLLFEGLEYIQIYHMSNNFTTDFTYKKLPKKIASELRSPERCTLLQESPFIACNRVGLYNYQEKQCYNNTELQFLVGPASSRRTLKYADNKKYALFNSLNNLYIFSTEKFNFLPKIQLNFYIGIAFRYEFFQSNVDQLLYFETITQSNQCAIYLVPNMIEVFHSSKQKELSPKDQICFHANQSPFMLIFSQSNLFIYQLPFDISRKPEIISNFYLKDESYFMIQNYVIYQISRGIKPDQTESVTIDSYDIKSFSNSTKEFILSKQQNDLYKEFWEEKEIILMTKYILSQGDIIFGWDITFESDPYGITGYSDRYNYIYIQHDENNDVSEFKLVSADVSEMYPFNSKTAQFRDTIQIYTENEYFKVLNNDLIKTQDEDNEFVTYFDLSTYQIIKQSLLNLKQEILLDIFTLIKTSNYSMSYPAEYKTSYQIFQLNKIKVKTDDAIYGFFWKCNIIIFKKSTVIKQYNLMDISNQCKMKKTKSQIFILNKDLNSFQKIFNHQGEIKSNIATLNQAQIVENFYIDPNEHWILVLIKQNPQNEPPNIQIYKNNYDQLEQASIAISSLLVSQISFFQFEELTFILIGLNNSINYLIQLPEYNTTQPLKSEQIKIIFQIETNTGKIMNFDQLIIEEKNAYRFLIYSSSQYRISLIQGTFNTQNKKFEESFKLRLQQYTHTRYEQQFKVQKNKYLTLFSSQQVTIYSLSLEYVARIEEVYFVQIQDVILALDLFTFFVTDNNGIYVYRVQNINDRQRLIILDKFSYISPQIYSIKYYEKDSPALIIFGVDAKQIFTIKISPNLNQDSNSCIQQIDSLSSQSSQLQQYFNILQQNQFDQEKQIYLQQVIQKEQIDIVLPTKGLNDIDDKDNPFLLQRIELDINLNGQEVNLIQNNPTSNIVNLLKSVKFSNGTLIIEQNIKLINMTYIIFKDIKFKLNIASILNIKFSENVTFDNCEFIKKEVIQSECRIVILFESVQKVILNNLKMDSLNMSEDSEISFQNCNLTDIFNLTITNSQFNGYIPFMTFKNQENKINIKNINVYNTIMNQFLQFQICYQVEIFKIKLNNVTKIAFQDNIRSRNLRDMNSQSFIISNYVEKYFSINEIEISMKSSFYSFLYYTNWIEEELDNNRDGQIIKKNIQPNSSFKFISSSIQGTQFNNGFMSIDGNIIEISDISIKNSIDCRLYIINAQQNLTITNLFFNENIITNYYSLLQIQNSVVNFTNLEISNSKIDYTNSKIDQVNSKQNELGFIAFTDSDYFIVELHAYNNTVKWFFMTFSGNFLFSKSSSIFKQYSNEPVSIIQDCTVKNTINGGGIYLNNQKKFILQNAFISFNNNTSTSKGGGISSKMSHNDLSNVTIFNNQATLYGGGIYLEESDLKLYKCTITNNSAQIGGGVRYVNKYFRPNFILNQSGENIIKDNNATIFGKNYGSFPQKIVIYSPDEQKNQEINNPITTIPAVSSVNQQSTDIQFQMHGEDGELVELKDNQNKDYDFIIEHNYYEDNQILIQQQNVSCIYQNNAFSFKKYILHKGFNNIKQNKQIDQNIFLIKIKSKFDVYYPKNENSIELVPQQLELYINLNFRKCRTGEIIKDLGQDYYECWRCQENTFSVADPYSNNLQNSCQECPKGAFRCEGDQIILYETYWRDENTTYIQKCVNTPKRCTNQTCAEGYIGPLCESCDYENKIWGKGKGIEGLKTYAKSGKYKCTICSDKISQKQQMLFSLLLGLGFLSYLAYQIHSNYNKKVIKMQAIYMKRIEMVLISNSLNESEKSSVAMKIMISYFQIVSIFSSQIQIPEEFGVLKFLGNSLEITLFSLDCFFVKMKAFQYIQMVYLRLIWMLFVPFLYIAFLYLFYLIVKCAFKIKQTKNRKKNLIISALLKIYYMVYPGIIQQTIGTFSCININNKTYVLNDLQFLCYDNQYFYYNFGVSLPFMIVTLVTPLLIMRKLILNKDHLTLDPNIFISYGFYFTEYKQSICYWEIIKIYQRIFIYIIIGLFNQSYLNSSILTTFIIFFYLSYQLKIQPFQYARFNHLDHLSQITAITTIICLAIYYITQSIPIKILQLMIIAIFNVYFFLKFMACFSSAIVRKPAFKVILRQINILHSYAPNIIPKITIKENNIIRLTKNWKKVKYSMETKYFKSQSVYNIQTLHTIAISQPTKKDLFQKQNKKSPLLKPNLQMSMSQKTEECSSIPSENMFSPPITIRLNTHIQSPDLNRKNKQVSEQISSESKMFTAHIELQTDKQN